jgi:hypothetical protein
MPEGTQLFQSEAISGACDPAAGFGLPSDDSRNVPRRNLGIRLGLLRRRALLHTMTGIVPLHSLQAPVVRTASKSDPFNRRNSSGSLVRSGATDSRQSPPLSATNMPYSLNPFRIAARAARPSR